MFPVVTVIFFVRPQKCMRSVHFFNSLFTPPVARMRASEANCQRFDSCLGLYLCLQTLNVPRGPSLGFFSALCNFFRKDFHITRGCSILRFSRVSSSKKTFLKPKYSHILVFGFVQLLFQNSPF